MVLSSIVVILYLSAMVRQLVLYRLPQGRGRNGLLLLGVLAGIIHAYLLYSWIDLPIGYNLNVVNLFSLACWLVSMGLCVLVVLRPVELSVIVAFPIAAISIVLVWWFPGMSVVKTAADSVILFHIIISTLAFSVLCLASVVAILLALQERLLRYKCFNLLHSLPSVLLMEGLLFQLIRVGWLLLTVVIITSLYCYSSVLLMPRILPKLIVVGMSWLIFSVLSAGRFFYGWRGSKVIYGTLFGVSLLVLAYFGSKIILESLYI